MTAKRAAKPLDLAVKPPKKAAKTRTRARTAPIAPTLDDVMEAVRVSGDALETAMDVLTAEVDALREQVAGGVTLNTPGPVVRRLM